MARDHIRRAEESLGDFHAELIGQTRAGRPVELEVRGRGVKFRGGTAVELVLADVGEKKRLLRQVVQHERLRAMGEMTTMVAHNFNNLLAVVLGRSQLLLRKTEDPEVREGLELIKTHAVRAGEMVRQLQEYFGEQVDLRFTEVDLNASVREVTVYLESLWRTMGEPGRPPVTVQPRPRAAAAGLRSGAPPAGRLPAGHHQRRRSDAGRGRDPRADARATEPSCRWWCRTTVPG